MRSAIAPHRHGVNQLLKCLQASIKHFSDPQLKPLKPLAVCLFQRFLSLLRNNFNQRC
jgi:hypothetical protein